jgi:hypothetical protein
MMKPICNPSSCLLAVVLFVASHVGLAQPVQSGAARQEQGPFTEINQRLNEAADAELASGFPFSRKAEQVDGTNGTRLSSGLLVVPTQWKDASAKRAIAKPLARLDALRWIIEPELVRAGLPAELAGMVLVESGAQAFALSLKGARGLWQLMPETALRYGLTVTAERDERLDPEASTRAAAAYIRDLRLRFNDWRLVLAAYNAGEDKVQKAIERAGTSDYQTLSAKRLIPEETRNYVPAVLRAIRILQEGGRIQAGSPEFARRLLYAVPTT